MTILARARPEIRALQAYSSARMEAAGGSVMLNANESPWPASTGMGLNRYPDPQPSALVKRLAQLYDADPGQILVGRGSDEAIDLLVRAFCRAEADTVIVCPPTFGMYAVSARIQNAAVTEVPMTRDFAADPDAVLAAVTPATKLVFLCSPNNPTGGIVPLSAIARIAAALTQRALVVVDEAYIEFSGSDSAVSLLPRLENIAVLRTLSKAHALAGARIGTLVAHTQVVSLLRRIQTPYPLPTLCTEAALAVLGTAACEATRERVDNLIAERTRLAPLLAALPQVSHLLPSAANFLCVRFSDAAQVYRSLLASGVIVRDVSNYPGLANCLRITVGTPQENSRLLSVLTTCEAAA